jgi:O-antigen/teichoic acid export membrane protein
MPDPRSGSSECQRDNSSPEEMSSRPVGRLKDKLAHAVARHGVPFSWSLLANVALAFYQWATLLLIARSSGPASLGEFALARSLATPAIALATMNGRAIQVSDVDRRFNFYHYVLLRSFLVALTVLGVTCVAYWTGGRHQAVLTFLVVLALALDALSDVALGQLQLSEQLDRIAVSGLARLLVGALLLSMCVLSHADVTTVALTLVGTSLLVMMGVDLPFAKATLRKPPAGTCARREIGRAMVALFHLSLPLAPKPFLAALFVNIPRYSIARWAGLSALGQYAALTSVLQAAGMVQSAFSTSSYHRLALYHATCVAKFRRLTGVVVAVAAANGLGVVLLVVVAGRFLVSTLYGSQFLTSPLLFPLLAIGNAIFLLASAVEGVVTSARRFTVQLPIYGATAVAIWVASSLVVPKAGLIGAAWAVISGMSVFALLFAGAARSVLAPSDRVS